MEDFIFYNELYLIYKDLFSENIQDVFDLYYGENLTMQEIADLKKISKARVGIIIKNTCKKLNDYENKLHIHSDKLKIEKVLETNDLNKIKRNIKSIIKGE